MKTPCGMIPRPTPHLRACHYVNRFSMCCFRGLCLSILCLILLDFVQFSLCLACCVLDFHAFAKLGLKGVTQIGKSSVRSDVKSIKDCTWEGSAQVLETGCSTIRKTCARNEKYTCSRIGGSKFYQHMNSKWCEMKFARVMPKWRQHVRSQHRTQIKLQIFGTWLWKLKEKLMDQ